MVNKIISTTPFNTLITMTFTVQIDFSFLNYVCPKIAL